MPDSDFGRLDGWMGISTGARGLTGPVAAHYTALRPIWLCDPLRTFARCRCRGAVVLTAVGARQAGEGWG